MASSLDFVQYVCAQADLNGAVSARKMFGEYGLYRDGKFFACVNDNALFIKLTDAGRALCPDCPLAPPYEGASNYLLVEDVDNAEALRQLVEVTVQALPLPKPKKPKQK